MIEQITTLALLAYEFFKTGLFTVGGGLATLPFLLDIADRYPTWYTRQMVLDMIAISESTPGPLGVNMATFVGYNIMGIPGAVVATFALVTPTLIIASLAARFLAKFNTNKHVQSALIGLRAAGMGMIASAGISVFSLSVLNLPAYEGSGNLLDLVNITALAIFAVFVAAMFKFKKVHPIVFMGVAAVIGIALKL